VFVVEEMEELGIGDSGKRREDVGVSGLLEFQCADEMDVFGEPGLEPVEELLRGAGGVAEDPVEFGEVMGEEGEGVLLKEEDVGEGGGERRAVDGDDVGAELVEGPAPASGACAEIEAFFAREGAASDFEEDLPELEIGAAGRKGALLEMDLSISKRAGTDRGGEEGVGVEEGKRAERRLRKRAGEGERLGRKVGELAGDEFGSAEVFKRGVRPEFLEGAELGGGV
jgi:hypothetical protein